MNLEQQTETQVTDSVFERYLQAKAIFKADREVLRPSYIPEKLPHREKQIDQLAQILVDRKSVV